MKDDLIAMIARHEGSKRDARGRHMPYNDTVGILTLGYGRNLQERGISEAEARVLLDNDVTDHRNELIVSCPWMQSLDEVRQAVLIDMAFNLGVPRLMGFRKMLAAARDGNYAEAAHEMTDSRWAHQVKERAYELADMMLSGEWSN